MNNLKIKNDRAFFTHFYCRKISWDDILKTTDAQDGEDDGSFTLHYIKNLGHVPPDKKGIRCKHTEKKVRSEKGRQHATLKLKENMEILLSQKGSYLSDDPRMKANKFEDRAFCFVTSSCDKAYFKGHKIYQYESRIRSRCISKNILPVKRCRRHLFTS